MNVHFIAIGGSVMHQLAIALHEKGYRVTGSDDEIFEPATGNLRSVGILPPAFGWFPEKIRPDLDAVILGMHAREDNPELIRARELGLAIYSFPEYIFQESRDKTRVVVGGSHGKTTTTSMIMHVLKTLGRDFDYMVGARLEGFDRSVRITDAPLIVCEGDEYPASALEKRPKFHFLFPQIAILTGIAWDHINVFPTFEGYLDQFRIFLDKIQPGGVLIYNDNDPVLDELVRTHKGSYRPQPYGIPTHVVRDGLTYLTLEGHTAPLSVFGNHNLLNAHAAWYACKALGVAPADFVRALSSFKGASKRLEWLYGGARSAAYRDFAHAPSKVKATIQAVRDQFPGRKLVAVLELHTYSSLQAGFLPQYAGALDPADEAAVFYSEHALELKRLPPLDPTAVAAAFGKPGLAVLHTPEALSAWLDARNYRDANLVLMSSGTFDGLNLSTFAARFQHQTT
jgi:UDP-N-acetylmuramate: L-alanyl-gamma-D-glutamyl-meso-diaminopimelate ligase